jgi:hypothetical protein
MKKNSATSFVSVLTFAALAFCQVPAQASSIVWNGNIDQGAVGWPRANNTTIMTGQTIGGHSALAPTSSGLKMSYQIDDAAHLGDNANQYTQLNSLAQATASMPANKLGSANPGWIPGAISENYTFSFQDYMTGPATGEVRLYAYNGSGAPPYNVNFQSYNYYPMGVLSTDWTLLYDSGILSSTTGWATVTTSGTISGDPEYFGIVLNANRGSNGVAAFDSISLNTQSVAPAPVPEPGTIMLLGAGFLGLAVYGKRRKNA